MSSRQRPFVIRPTPRLPAYLYSTPLLFLPPPPSKTTALCVVFFFPLRPKELLDGRRPCVVMATPGTLEGGLSGRLLGRWCEARRNGVVLTGFLPEGTPARELTRVGRDKAFVSEGQRRELNCAVKAGRRPPPPS